MSLAPGFVADVLARQGVITPEQAEEVKREARQMGDKVRSAMTYEQKAVAYDLVSSYRFSNLKNGGGTVGEVLGRVFADNPRLRTYVLDDQGALRKHMMIFVDGKQLVDRERLSDPVGPAAEIYVMQALSGG